MASSIPGMTLAKVTAANALVHRADGATALIGGGTSGIGHGVAMRLARAGYAVTIMGRDAARGREIVEQLRGIGGGPHEFMPCDATLLANVHTCAATYAATHSRLDALVLSQGMATMQGRTPTSEGLDMKMALHYYGRMAFIVDLLPLLRAAPSGRVLSVLSPGVHPGYPHYSTDPELMSHYSTKTAAEATCFYNDLAMDALALDAANSRITFTHAMPGFVNTRWGTELPWYLRGLVRLIQPFGRSITDCGEFMSYPLLSPDVRPGMMLMTAEAGTARRTDLHSDAARDSVWAHTMEILRRTAPAAPPAAAAAASATVAADGQLR